MENRPWSRDSDIEGFQVGIFLFFGRYDVRALFFGTGSSMGFSTDFLELFLGWMLVYVFFWGTGSTTFLGFFGDFLFGIGIPSKITIKPPFGSLFPSSSESRKSKPEVYQAPRGSRP